MINVENLTFSFTDKILYNGISFTIEDGDHAVLIGSNGTGKSTLVEILMAPERWIFKGTVTEAPDLRIGYVSQYSRARKDRSLSVFQFLMEEFDAVQARMDRLGEAMADAADPDAAAEAFQTCMDEFAAMDGYNAESNILKELHLAGLDYLKDTSLSDISGGEYQLVQVIREIMRKPELLVLDEPDAFLDFENIAGLKELINHFGGTLLAVTHSRYLLNHCFDKVLHLEDASLHEFDGSYPEYTANLLRMKLAMLQAAEKEEEWIQIQEALVERVRTEATIVISPQKGQSLHARVSYLERLKQSRTPIPFTEVPAPKITLPELPESGADGPEFAVKAENYSVRYDELLLDNVSFTILPGEKVALVGPNGTGKSTLLREIIHRSTGKVTLSDGIRPAFLSQLHGETLDEQRRIYDIFLDAGLRNRNEVRAHLKKYGLPEDISDRAAEKLSGGEKNLLQLALIELSGADLLLLDEPSGHLDIWAQEALIRAVNDYRGTVLMVSHDFYSIADCVDYVLYVENNTIRKMSGRAFRKMIYKRHFPKEYLLDEQKRQELEMKAGAALRKHSYEQAAGILDELDEVTVRMRTANSSR